jgi:hypothetical protein
VSQQAAGSHWGGLATPHVGQEVVVSFLEGDPDRPLVTGHVHNGLNMPPLNLPADKDKTILRDHGDNKIIMHGKAGAQWMSLVSPRAVNLVAMQAPAKPLSADVVLDGVGFDPSQDNGAFGELEFVYNELAKQLNQSTASGAHAPDIGKDVPDEAHHGQSTAFEHDINSLSEGAINSLSLKNTNTWVGGNSNTWVKGDVNQEIVGKTDTVSHGDTTNTYHSQVTDNFEAPHDEQSPMHNENTGMHNEFTMIHDDFNLWHNDLHIAHLDLHLGWHWELHLGWHLDLNNIACLKKLVIELEDKETEVQNKKTEVKTAGVTINNTGLMLIACEVDPDRATAGAAR